MCKETKERQEQGEWKVKVRGLGKYRKVGNGATEERVSTTPREQERERGLEMKQ